MGDVSITPMSLLQAWPVHVKACESELEAVDPRKRGTVMARQRRNNDEFLRR